MVLASSFGNATATGTATGEMKLGIRLGWYRMILWNGWLTGWFIIGFTTLVCLEDRAIWLKWFCSVAIFCMSNMWPKNPKNQEIANVGR
jgi:hypothetical protein